VCSNKLPLVAKYVAETVTPQQDWGPGPASYSVKADRYGHTFDSARCNNEPFPTLKTNAFSIPSQGQGLTEGPMPGRSTSVKQLSYGRGRVGALSDLTMTCPATTDSPGPSVFFRSEQVVGSGNVFAVHRLKDLGSRISFDKSSSRYNAQGLVSLHRRQGFGSGHDDAAETPCASQYLPLTRFTGASASLGDAPSVNFKSCAPHSALTGRYLGRRSLVHLQGKGSPGPIYDVRKIYAARRFALNEPDSSRVAYTFEHKGKGEFEVLVEREQQLPGPAQYTPTCLNNGAPIQALSGPKIGSEPRMHDKFEVSRALMCGVLALTILFYFLALICWFLHSR